MAFITAELKIPEVGVNMVTRLYFPTDLPAEVGNKVKGVVTLLHGLCNSGNDWMMMSAACRYAADNGYILVAPDTGNSFDTDMRNGPPYFTILTQLLPAHLGTIFKIPTAREANYIAGMSMGGYGAMLLGLSCPERYAAIGSFSGVLDMQWMAAQAKTGHEIYRVILPPALGEGLQVPENLDLFALAQKVARLPEADRPRIFCSCGAQDEDGSSVHSQNQAYRRVAEALPLDYHYAEWSGVHEWNFWDRSLAEFIGFIQGSDYGRRKRMDWGAPDIV